MVVKTLDKNFSGEIFLIHYNYLQACRRGVATVEARESCPPLPYFNFRTKQGANIPVPNIRDIAFYECYKIIRTKNFTIFIMVLQVLYNYGGFSFFLTT